MTKTTWHFKKFFRTKKNLFNLKFKVEGENGTAKAFKWIRLKMKIFYFFIQSFPFNVCVCNQTK